MGFAFDRQPRWMQLLLLKNFRDVTDWRWPLKVTQTVHRWKLHRKCRIHYQKKRICRVGLHFWDPILPKQFDARLSLGWIFVNAFQSFAVSTQKGVRTRRTRCLSVVDYQGKQNWYGTAWEKPLWRYLFAPVKTDQFVSIFCKTKCRSFWMTCRLPYAFGLVFCCLVVWRQMFAAVATSLALKFLVVPTTFLWRLSPAGWSVPFKNCQELTKLGWRWSWSL